MQEAYVVVNNVPTHIMTWGKWVEESLDGCREVVICITGNPGLPGFYTKFLSTLHSDLESESSSPIPVWIIGHAGHDEPKATSLKNVPPLNGNENLYNLDGQIQHKIAFINKYVPKDVKIHLIGHSIGAWIILQLLKNDEIREKTQKTYMLFPTIERMRESSNGQLFTRILVPILFLLAYIVNFFNILPMNVRVFLIYIYFWTFSIPSQFIGTAVKYIKWSVIEKVTFLAKDEMNTVTHLDIDLIEKNKHLMKFYYGRTDGWVPIKYFTEIKEKIPDIDACLDDKNIAHAFVLRSSIEMAYIVSNWIKDQK